MWPSCLSRLIARIPRVCCYVFTKNNHFVGVGMIHTITSMWRSKVNCGSHFSPPPSSPSPLWALQINSVHQAWLQMPLPTASPWGPHVQFWFQQLILGVNGMHRFAVKEEETYTLDWNGCFLAEIPIIIWSLFWDCRRRKISKTTLMTFQVKWLISNMSL